jgi:hypothetical protein
MLAVAFSSTLYFSNHFVKNIVNEKAPKTKIVRVPEIRQIYRLNFFANFFVLLKHCFVVAQCVKGLLPR